MLRWFTVLVAGFAAVLLVAGSVAPFAQAQTQKPPAPHATMPKTIEGKVAAADQSKHMVKLDDGSEFIIPAGVRVDWSKVKPGAMVAVDYEEKDGHKTAKRITVKS